MSLVLGFLLQSPDGDVIDCVLSHLQPAFDHPELRGQNLLVNFCLFYQLSFSLEIDINALSFKKI